MPISSNRKVQYPNKRSRSIHSACRQSHGQNITFFKISIGRTSLCFTDQKTQEENVLEHKLPFGSVLTPANSCTMFKIRSAHSDSPMAKIFLFFQFLGRTSLCFSKPRNSGRDCAWWTNSLMGQFLHQLSHVQSSRSIQPMQIVPSPKRFFFLIFREGQSLLHRPRNAGRECAWWTNSLMGQFLHQLSPVQSSRSI